MRRVKISRNTKNHTSLERILLQYRRTCCNKADKKIIWVNASKENFFGGQVECIEIRVAIDIVNIIKTWYFIELKKWGFASIYYWINTFPFSILLYSVFQDIYAFRFCPPNLKIKYFSPIFSGILFVYSLIHKPLFLK